MQPQPGSALTRARWKERAPRVRPRSRRAARAGARERPRARMSDWTADSSRVVSFVLRACTHTQHIVTQRRAHAICHLEPFYCHLHFEPSDVMIYFSARSYKGYKD